MLCELCIPVLDIVEWQIGLIETKGISLQTLVRNKNTNFRAICKKSHLMFQRLRDKNFLECLVCEDNFFQIALFNFIRIF